MAEFPAVHIIKIYEIIYRSMKKEKSDLKFGVHLLYTRTMQEAMD